MEEIYIVTRYIIPVAGNDSRSQERFNDITQARKRWHTIVATDLGNANIAWEMIQIVRGADGICIASEIIDNRIPPEPEPEPTPEPEPEEPEEPTEPETPEEGE